MTRRGDVYWVAFDPVKGSEQGGLRPALVVQQDVGNRYSPTTVVAAITRTLPAKPYPFVVVVEPEESGLRARSAVNCAQLATIQQAGPESSLRPPVGSDELRPVGHLSDATMARVDRALRYNLGLG
ncbi:MAG: type II toxin-antitoxin system PemK/MazF family toxin [Acidobacteria bacterium]|nr:MAG: type II toxin-antitoxin system PemK/MazF family toxin [Acidobacteriota bacterium]